MTSSFAVKGGNRRYRYYTSAALQKGRAVEAGSLPRVPAEPVEQLVLDRAIRLLGISSQAGKSLVDHSLPADRNVWTTVRDALLRVEVGANKVVLLFRRDAVDGNAGRGSAPEDTLRARLPAGDALSHDRETVILTIAVTLKQRRGSGLIIGPGGTPAIDTPQIDLVLLKALGRAQAWRDAVVFGAELTLTAIALPEPGCAIAKR
jgi:site-specific DNA recombinase